MSHDTEDDAKFQEKPICCFKNDKNLVNFDPSTQVSKICTLIGPFRANYIMFGLKKYRGVIFHEIEVSCKIWRKTDLWFGKWREEFGKFSPEHSEVSKLRLWWDPFIQSRNYMSLKFTEELCVMTVMNDAKFEEELTCCFKIDMRNLTNFDPSTQKVSKIFTLMGSFWTKYIMFELKKYRRVMFDDTEDWCKIWRKTDLCFLKWHEEFGKFSQSEKKQFHFRK